MHAHDFTFLTTPQIPPLFFPFINIIHILSLELGHSSRIKRGHVKHKCQVKAVCAIGRTVQSADVEREVPEVSPNFSRLGQGSSVGEASHGSSCVED